MARKTLGIALFVLVAACNATARRGSDRPDMPPIIVLPDVDGMAPRMNVRDAGASNDLDIGDVLARDIRELKQGRVDVDSLVHLNEVVVTARKELAGGGALLFVGETIGAPEYSGIAVRLPMGFAVPAVGDLVSLEGTLRRSSMSARLELREITAITRRGTATLPSLRTVTASELAYSSSPSSPAQMYDGVVVRIENATASQVLDTGEVVLDSGLRVATTLLAFTPPAPGKSWVILTGILDTDGGTSRLLPRTAADFDSHGNAPDMSTPADMAAPTMLALAPSSITLAPGGTGLVEVVLPQPAAAAINVDLSSSDGAIIVPASLAFPAGAQRLAFRARASLGGGSATITARLGAASATLAADTAAPSAPRSGDVAFNEIVFKANVDFNCDGNVNNSHDELIELHNTATHALQLADLSIWDKATYKPSQSARFSFPDFVLGPGETVVVFGRDLGIMESVGPWCRNLMGSTATVAGHIGDAAAFSAPSGLGLNDDGDNLYLTAAKTWDSSLVNSAVWTSGTESLTRSPDFTGALVPYSSAPGAAMDRKATPGTRLNGAPFAINP